ncbi:cytochrome P450 [Aspergillus karnatakaensis]|uniref:cytochrome P450 n=1 Tax=Aspergillus karnatakaensis TaxID=1810916 RepID=UPI003CCDD0CB
MLSLSLVAVLALLTPVLYLIHAVIAYFKDPKELRRFPTPSPLAALTPLWSMYYSHNCAQTTTIYSYHQKHGPILRIAPNHISFTDPAAYKDIYGHGTSLRKDDFYSNVADGNPSLSQATDKSIHSGKRRSLAHVFSAREITAMEPRVMSCVADLYRAITIKSKGGMLGSEDEYPVTATGSFDIRPWLNMFAYDAVTSMLFTNNYHFLKKGNDLCPSTDPSGKTTHVHAMHSFHSASRFNSTIGQLTHPFYNLTRSLLSPSLGNKAGVAFGGMSRFQVLHRLANEPSKPDLFSSFPTKPTEKRPLPMPVDELIAECATMLDAGNDTTQSTLTNAIFLLSTTPRVQRKLYRELHAALPQDLKASSNNAELKIPPTSVLKEVPYLKAVLEENWRCRPPVARGLPRRTTGEGAIIAGVYIPPDVTVSASIYAVHRDESLFRRAGEFIPERWLPCSPCTSSASDGGSEKGGDGDGVDFTSTESELQNLKNYCIPFSLGPRACIGRNLAYMEVSLVVAALVLNFEWEVANPGEEMEMVERFNYNPKELFVRVRPRE